MDQFTQAGPGSADRVDAGQPVDRDRLAEFDQILQKYKAGKQRLEHRVVASERWWTLHNEAEERKRGIGLDEGFRAKSGWLHNVIVSKHADAMEAYPEALVLPREPGDKELSHKLTSVLPVILEQNHFEETYSDVMWQKLKTGTGVYKVTWDQDALNGLGEISIQRVDLLSVFWEPGITDIQKSRYFFHCELQDNELLEEEYPELKDRLHTGGRFSMTKFLYDDTVSTEGKSVVIDVYYKRRENGRTVLHYCKYCGDTVLASTENDAAGVVAPEDEDGFAPDRLGALLQGGPRALAQSLGLPLGGGGGLSGGLDVLDRKETGDTSSTAGVGPRSDQGIAPYGDGGVGQGPMAGMAPGMGAPGLGIGAVPGLQSEPEHYGLYDHGLYPFVFDALWPVEGSPAGYGFIDLCMNAQIQVDMLDTAFLRNAMIGATPRYFQRVGGAINEEEFMDLTRPTVHVNGNLDEQFLRVIDYKPLAGGYLNFYQNKISELRETSGNTESANGIYSGGVTAASSIAALQEAAGKTSRDSSRASYWAFRQLIDMMIELVRQFYTLPRTFRITGENGQEQFTQLDNSGLQPQAMGVGSELIGYRMPVFDVKVEIQKRNAYTRTSQNELALQLYSLGFFNPQMAPMALSCLDMMDFDGKEDLLQKIQLNGTLMQQLQHAQQIALMLAQKYEPETAQKLMQGMGGMPAPGGAAGPGKPPEIMEGDRPESSIVSRARDRANQAASPAT